MKKSLLAAFGLVAVLGLAALTVHPKPAVAAPEVSSRVILEWNTLGTAAGAAITSPVFTSVKNCETVEVLADNSAGGSSRTLNIDWLGSDGTTILYRRAVTVTNGTRAAVLISPRDNTATPSGETVVPAALGTRMQFTLASAGAAAGSLAVYCR